MDITKLTANSLIMLHDCIREALVKDDKQLDDKGKIYQVRELPDWKDWCKAIENQLDARSESYERIKW